MDPTFLAGSILLRVARRQESTAHLRLLTAIQSTPLRDKAVLCGSAALHGVHLTSRCQGGASCSRRTATIDLRVTPLFAIRFAALLEEAGVSLEICSVRNKYALSDQKSSLPRINAWVHVHPSQSMPTRTVRQTFFDSAGNQTEVLTIPFVDAAVDKVCLMAMRHLPTDYLDVWLVVKRAPEVAAEVRRHPTVDSGVVDVASALARLSTMNAERWQSLSRLVLPMPSLDQVASDLREWWGR